MALATREPVPEPLAWACFVALKAVMGALAGVALYLSVRVRRRWWRCSLPLIAFGLVLTGDLEELATSRWLTALLLLVATSLISGAFLGSIVYLFGFGRKDTERPLDRARADPGA